MKDLIIFEPKYRTLVGFLNYRDLFPILEDVSNRTGISIIDICSKSHKRELAEARQIFLKRAITLFPLMRPDHIARAINRSKSIGYNSWKNVDQIPSLKKKYRELYAE